MAESWITLAALYIGQFFFAFVTGVQAFIVLRTRARNCVSLRSTLAPYGPLKASRHLKDSLRLRSALRLKMHFKDSFRHSGINTCVVP